jgi:hypothetical protein
MSYLAINNEANAWGQGVSEAEAGRNAAKMAQIAKEAGMTQIDSNGFPGVYEPNSTDVFMIDDNDDDREIDWFSWYCSESKPGRTVKALAKMFKKDVLGI